MQERLAQLAQLAENAIGATDFKEILLRPRDVILQRHSVAFRLTTATCTALWSFVFPLTIRSDREFPGSSPDADAILLGSLVRDLSSLSTVAWAAVFAENFIHPNGVGMALTCLSTKFILNMVSHSDFTRHRLI